MELSNQKEPDAACPGWGLLCDMTMAGLNALHPWWTGPEKILTLDDLVGYLTMALANLKDIRVWGGQGGPGFINTFGVQEKMRNDYAKVVLRNAHNWLDHYRVFSSSRPIPIESSKFWETSQQLDALTRWVGGIHADAVGIRIPKFRKFSTIKEMAESVDCTVQSIGNWRRYRKLEVIEQDGVYIVDEEQLKLLARSRKPT
jgi:hypothetical protein